MWCRSGLWSWWSKAAWWQFFFSAMRISWLKHILRDNGKITNLWEAMCPLTCSIKNHGGEFANIIMQRVKHSFGENVYKHYKTSLKCTPLTFDVFFSFFLQSIYIIMSIYAEGKRSFYQNMDWLWNYLSWEVFLPE